MYKAEDWPPEAFYKTGLVRMYTANKEPTHKNIKTNDKNEQQKLEESMTASPFF